MILFLMYVQNKMLASKFTQIILLKLPSQIEEREAPFIPIETGSKQLQPRSNKSLILSVFSVIDLNAELRRDFNDYKLNETPEFPFRGQYICVDSI